MWQTTPITLQVKGSQVAIRFSSLRAFKLSVGLSALSLLLGGWLFGSGLLALKAMFSPSVEILHGSPRTSLHWQSESKRPDTTPSRSGERWTIMSSGYAGIKEMDMPTGGKKGNGHE